MPEHIRLTPEERQEIREREKKATPGPWGTYRSRNGWHYTTPCGTTLYDQTRSDAEFVAAARTAVPRLQADLEDAEREVAELREKLRRWETGDVPPDWLDGWPKPWEAGVITARTLRVERWRSED